MFKEYLKTIFLSFYSPFAYSNALNNWNGRGLKYLLIVNILTGIIISSGFLLEIRKVNPAQIADAITGFIISEPDLTFEENLNRFMNILHQIPKIRVNNDRFLTDEAKPYHITDPVSGYDLAIIDTSGEYTSLKDTDASLLVTDTNITAISSNENTEERAETTTSLVDFKKQYNIDENTINELLYFLGRFPILSLQNGRLVTENDQTFDITNNQKTLLAQVGKDAKLNDDSMEPIIAISTDKISYKTFSGNQSNSIKLVDLNEQTFFEFIKNGISYLKNFFMWVVPLAALPFTIFISFAISCLTLLLYSFIGLSFSKLMKAGEFNYMQIMRVAAVAMTPMLILSTIIPHLIPNQGAVYFLISVGYLYYAIKSVSKA